MSLLDLDSLGVFLFRELEGFSRYAIPSRSSFRIVLFGHERNFCYINIPRTFENKPGDIPFSNVKV